MKEFVLSLKEKNNTTLVFLLSNCPHVLSIFNDSLVKYVWLFRYMIKFSCLYIPPVHYFIQMNMEFFERNSIFKTPVGNAPECLGNSFTFPANIHACIVRSSYSFHLYTPKPQSEMYRKKMYFLVYLFGFLVLHIFKT